MHALLLAAGGGIRGFRCLASGMPRGGGHLLTMVHDRVLTRALSGVPDPYTPRVPSSTSGGGHLDPYARSPRGSIGSACPPPAYAYATASRRCCRFAAPARMLQPPPFFLAADRAAASHVIRVRLVAVRVAVAAATARH